jgi:hypothetical protein
MKETYFNFFHYIMYFSASIIFFTGLFFMFTNPGVACEEQFNDTPFFILMFTSVLLQLLVHWIKPAPMSEEQILHYLNRSAGSSPGTLLKARTKDHQ